LIEQQLDRRQDIVVISNRSNTITLGLNHCFATGNWGVPKSSYIRTGVSQVLSRLTYNSFLSHLKKILIPIGKEGKNTKVRQINSSQIGFICPHETPEGSQSGIVKNMTSFVNVTVQEDFVLMREIIEGIPCIETNFQKWILNIEEEEKPFVRILINGNWVGITYNFEETWRRIKEYKNIDLFSENISYHYNDTFKEICIFSDEGRMTRPLFPRSNMPTLEDLKSKTFQELLNEKKIEFLDSYQIENEIIAMNKKELDSKSYYTYCEIHPSVISSISVSLIPYPEHTQSPRVTYHAAMGKQAIGLPVSNFSFRMDTTQHILSYPERPLIQSHHGEYTQCNQLPFGNNLIVAVLMYSGFNQEDSVILNRSAIQRGLFHSFCYKTLVIEEKKKNSLMSEVICKLPVQYQSKSFDYSKLNENGIVKVGSYVGIGDVIVSKLQKKTEKKNQQDELQDNSVIIKSGEEGYVDKVYITSSPDGYKIIKVQIRTIKIPEIGDKVASRSAQKGTVSMVLNQEDMPCSISGIVPDLIINPLCIPSRMTINQLIECIAAKNSAHTGKFKYCTAFSEHSQDVIPKLSEELEKNGFHKHGEELMINGMSGELLDSQIFIGPTYYHRLKHLVASKIHARNQGSLQALTRQPLEGRSRDGGLRFGEMERDCMISHGVSRFLQERLFDVSDYFQFFVCGKCGNTPHNTNECNLCHNKIIEKISLPYACKLLFQQLLAMGIKINLIPKNNLLENKKNM
jgi:DNA-directed RNA polymerase II subunit RPB2